MHLYVPFNDESLIYGAEHMKADTTVFVHGASGMSLSRLPEDTPLFVVAHGRYSRADQIGGEVKGFLGKKTVYLTASELAKYLVKDGLPRRFLDLRLMVCWSGYVGGDSQWGSHTLKRKADAAPFAGLVCAAMKTSGFTRIVVTGYTGEVLIPTPTSTTPVGGVMVDGIDGGRIRTSDADRSLSRLALSASVTPGCDKRRRTVGTLDNAYRTVWH